MKDTQTMTNKMDAINAAIYELVTALLKEQNSTTFALKQAKIQSALADIKRARTLLDKANNTLEWSIR